MEKDKQIEEMTDIIVKQNCKPCGCENCDFAYEYGTKEESCEDYVSYRRMAEGFYNAGYRKQREGEWISVDERLPDSRKFVLVCDEYGNVGEAYFFKNDGRFEWLDDEERVFATHWMPLPEAPKMRKEDENGKATM